MIQSKLAATTALVLALVFAAASAAEAQAWRGMGRVAGKVVDESGKPIEGVVVKAALPAAGNAGPSEGKTNRKGEWAFGGIARGSWALDFVKEGYETKSISISVSEVSRIPPMEIVMKKAAVVVDPNVEIKEQLTKAAGLLNEKKFAEARAIYEGLSAKYPEVKQFQPLIARAYYGEGNKEKAIEFLRAAAESDPENIEVRLLLGNTMVETGQAEEGRKILESIDESKVTDPTFYVNAGIEMINNGKQAQAVTWFDRAIARFPDHPDAYYYRGISRVALGNAAGAKEDLEKFVSIAPPDAPELATAKKILESLK
ncbi:MAG: tetratricopeptide repeat protein [Acidobacteria bacterium]|nr:tetratricopeptide repeat protein [Acidobacteriota bacterium]